MPAITVFFICPCFKKQSKLLFKQMVRPATETGITAPESQAGSLKCLLLWRGGGWRGAEFMRSFLSRFAGDGALTHFVSFGTNWAKWANWPQVTFQTLGNRSAQYIISFCLKTMQHVKGLYSFLPLHNRGLQGNGVPSPTHPPPKKKKKPAGGVQLSWSTTDALPSFFFFFPVTLPRSVPPHQGLSLLLTSKRMTWRWN